MKLRQFDLDGDELDKTRRQEFALSTRCISALYERHFTPSFSGDGWKVLVNCVERRASERVTGALGVLCCEARFDFESYERASILAKKKVALEVLHRGALAVAAHKGWPIAEFEAARAAVVAARYRNEWSWRRVWNRARTNQAEIFFAHDVGEFIATLSVVDRDGKLVHRSTVLTSPPDEFLFHQKFGRLRWVDDGEIVLVDKDGERVTSARFDRNLSTWVRAST